MKAGEANEEERKPGFLLQLFGTDLALWGFRTRTLNPGLLGRWPRLDEAAEARFRALDAQAATLTLRVFRAALAALWEDFEPGRYNVVHAAFRFFEDLVQILPVLSGEVESRDWAAETRTVQASFARLLSYRDSYQVLMTDLPAYLEARDHDKETMQAVRRILTFITGLTLYPPTFKNTIIARRSLPQGTLQNWERIKEELKIPPANLSVYDAPDNVQKLIFRKIEKLREEQKNLARRQQELREIARHLQRDEAGVMKPVHLEAAIDFVLENVTGLTGVDKDPVKWIGRPHRLVFAVFKDVELNFVRLLNGALRLRGSGHQSEEAFIFQPACFKSQIEAFGSVTGALQRINRQTAEIDYTYEHFLEYRDRRPDDPLIRYVNDVCGRALNWMRSMTERIELLLRQHEAARELLRQGQGAELQAGAEQPVDRIPEEPRLLPFADRLIVARYHLNGKTVREALDLFLGRLYQCRYRFREPDLMKTIDQATYYRDQAMRVAEELERLGVRS